MLYYAENVTAYGEAFLRNFDASRCVEEQVAAQRLLCLPDSRLPPRSLNLTGFQMQVQTRNRTRLTREQINARNRRNRSQCFTAEAQCADSIQIVPRYAACWSRGGGRPQVHPLPTCRSRYPQYADR